MRQLWDGWVTWNCFLVKWTTNVLVWLESLIPERERCQRPGDEWSRWLIFTSTATLTPFTFHSQIGVWCKNREPDG
tara:strand:- start:60 stop:287 length:228 start_codon:yes stop_codon:yes gene_type:complete